VWQHVFGRYRVILSRLGWLFLPVVALLGLSTLGHNENEVRDWLPRGYPETFEYERFQGLFGNDEFVLVSWEGCEVGDERLAKFERLISEARVKDLPESAGLVRKVSSGRSVLEQLQGAPLSLERAEALRRLSGTLVGRDGRLTCALLWLTPEARADVHGTLARVRVLLEQCGVPFRDVCWAGAPVVNAELDAASARSMSRAIVFSCVAALGIAWAALREWRVVLMVLTAGFYSATLSLAVLRICGVPMNSLLISMIPMVYTAGISGAIHMCNYYTEALRSRSPAEAAVRAVECAWLPLALAAATTAAGLLSICLNDLKPVQQFGFFSALGIGLSWLLLVFWLPAALAGIAVGGVRGARSGAVGEVTESEAGDAPLPLFWVRFGEFVVRRSGWITAGCLLLMVASIPGALRLQISMSLLEEFREDAEVLRMGAWIEDRLADLTTCEVALRFPEGSRLSGFERLRLTRRLQSECLSIDSVSGALSIASFAPALESSAGGVLQRAGMNRRLQQQRAQLLDSGFLGLDGGDEFWRISLRLRKADQLDYNRLVQRIRTTAGELLQGDRAEGVEVLCTGVAPVIYRARRSLVDGLVLGLGTDVLLIVGAIVVAMRTASSGVLLGLASLFPTLIVLGLLGWLGIAINVGAVMAPCVALGVTVDDSIHFMVWFRSGIWRGLGESRSVLLAWRACVRPIYQSWMLLGLGMATQFVNDFASIRQFGMMMTAMLTASLVGNLVLQPALLASPIGRILARGFLRRGERGRVTAADPESPL
jgi:predicted RND superfamily exporter protein